MGYRMRERCDDGQKSSLPDLERRKFLSGGAGLVAAAVAAPVISMTAADQKAVTDPEHQKGGKMTTTYDPEITALLCIDLYNDFLSEGGKLYPLVKDVAKENNMHENLRTVVKAARDAGVTVYHVPHHRWQPGDYVDWKYPSPYQLGGAERQSFAKDTWGGTFHDDFQVQPGDIVATEHWGSSGFPNTDLEHKLKRYGKEKIICVGLIANTCVEATARIGMELGFHVTLVRDATAARSREALHAAHDINGPTYAHRILTTAELVKALKQG